jgi:1-acyl-sn-glycerol-3-phosphate acyltransferase
LRERLAGAARIEEALQRGESIFVFPESRLAPTPQLLPFRLGGFAAAVAAQCPIVPITLRGTSRVLPCDSWFFERGPISVTIHPPIHPQSSGWREVLRLRDEVRRCIDSVRGVS